MYRTTREFVAAVEKAGLLARVGARVSPVLEIAEIADRESKSATPAPHGLPSAPAQRADPRFFGMGGRALLFEDVEGSDIPVLINGWGSYRRMEMALGCDVKGVEPGRFARGEGNEGGFEAIARVIGELVKPEPPRSLREAVAKARQFLPLLRIPPKRKRGMGECQQVVVEGDAVDLRRLPIIKCWPHDGDFAALGYPAGVNDGIAGVDRSPEFLERFGGRYITLGGIHTVHARDADAPKPSSHNIGMYRVQVLGQRTMAMHWHVHHDGAAHWRSWKALGKKMPVAIALGGESVMPYAATCPLPPGISELLMAGFLHGSGIPLCRGRTVPLWVPANAEIVIEGYVSEAGGPIGWDPRSGGALGPGAVFEGPFGDHTGFYSLPDRYPILEVTAVTHRRDPIYPTTIVGLPPQEDYYLGKATERVMLPLLKTILPDIADYDLPLFGAFHNAAFVRIEKHYPLHARRVMHGVWGAGQMSWTKTVFVVGSDVDVHNTAEVLRAAAAHCDPSQDIERVRGPIDILDHATPVLGAGTKIGFDCTPKRQGERWGGRHAGATGNGALLGEPALLRVRSIDRVVSVSLAEELDLGWMFVAIDKNGQGQGREVARRVLEALPPGGAKPRFVVVLDASVDVEDFDAALFHWAANMSPDRDMLLSADGSRAAFDATPKVPGDAHGGFPVREWPPLIEMSDEIKERVSARWAEYGLGGGPGAGRIRGSGTADRTTDATPAPM